jgi:hypothetical protein
MPTQAVMDELDGQALNRFPPPPPMGNSGGLGGLGGIPQQPKSFLQGDQFRTILQAVGSSLLSSPGNAPLSQVPQYLDAYSARNQKQQEGLRDRSAVKSVLMKFGATEQEAEQLSYNSAAAELWLKQRTSQQGLAADNAFAEDLNGIGGTGSSGDPFPGSVGGQRRNPSVLTDPRPVSRIATDPDAGRQVAQAEVPATLPGAPTGRMDELLRRREAYVQLGGKARTSEQMAKVRLQLDNLDQAIEREEERQKPTESLRELSAINQQRKADGLPAYRLDEWQQMKARSGATNIDMKGPSKYDEVLNTELAKRAIAIEDGATTARKSLGTLKLMESAIASPGFYSGTGAGSVANLKRVATALGLPGADGIDSIESFNAMSRQAALDAMGGSLGAGFSNADRGFVEQQVANLENTPQGNKALIDIQRATAKRQIEIARLARAYAEKNEGRIDGGFYERLSQWAEQNPMFVGDEVSARGDDKQNRAGGGSGRAGSATGPSRQRATNPQTGQTLEWDGNQWSPVR